jgi:hypothetical protein
MWARGGRAPRSEVHFFTFSRDILLLVILFRREGVVVAFLSAVFEAIYMVCATIRRESGVRAAFRRASSTHGGGFRAFGGG